MCRGATADEARIVFGDYPDAEPRGNQSHGFVSFEVALSQFPPTGRAVARRVAEAASLVEGQGD